MDRNMFYGAKPQIFDYACQMRNNMTKAEKILWEHLKKNKLGNRFKAQHPVDTFIVDFYCHQIKLAIEIDGDIHKQQTEYDAGRTYELENLGIKVIRFSNNEVLNDINKVLEKIKSCLASAGNKST